MPPVLDSLWTFLVLCQWHCTQSFIPNPYQPHFFVVASLYHFSKDRLEEDEAIYAWFLRILSVFYLCQQRLKKRRMARRKRGKDVRQWWALTISFSSSRPSHSLGDSSLSTNLTLLKLLIIISWNSRPSWLRSFKNSNLPELERPLIHSHFLL